MTDIQIETQYSTGVSRQAIEQALVAAGKDLGHLRPEDLALLEDFHTMGRIATAQLFDLAGITPGDEVLDAGSGIGGTARYLAGRSGCHVVAVDLTGEYCRTARWLNQLAGLDDRICVRQADVTDLPFEDATFTVMFSQHVQMNVADKPLLYQEARRVLAAGGRLAVWDIVAGDVGEPDFPLPWADRPEYSHLATSGRLRAAIETSGFEIEQWNDLTVYAAPMMQTLLTLPPSPIGLQAFVPNLPDQGHKPHRRARRRPAPRRPGPRTSGLRRLDVLKLLPWAGSNPAHRPRPGGVAPSGEGSPRSDIPPGRHLRVTQTAPGIRTFSRRAGPRGPGWAPLGFRKR